jgi:hypothetical protein
MTWAAPLGGSLFHGAFFWACTQKFAGHSKNHLHKPLAVDIVTTSQRNYSRKRMASEQFEAHWARLNRSLMATFALAFVSSSCAFFYVSGFVGVSVVLGAVVAGWLSVLLEYLNRQQRWRQLVSDFRRLKIQIGRGNQQ